MTELVIGGTRLAHLEQAISELDLEPIVFKLTHPEPGEDGLSLAQADQDVTLYKGFLALCGMYPDIPVVPSRRIDRVWHAHILDTAKYRTDCENLFGRPLDHFPYAGMRGEDDRLQWMLDYARTVRLFQQHFGIDLVAGEASCDSHGGGGMCVKGDCEHAATVGVRPRPDRRGGPDGVVAVI